MDLFEIDHYAPQMLRACQDAGLLLGPDPADVRLGITETALMSGARTGVDRTIGITFGLVPGSLDNADDMRDLSMDIVTGADTHLVVAAARIGDGFPALARSHWEKNGERDKQLVLMTYTAHGPVTILAMDDSWKDEQQPDWTVIPNP